jgi:hypothetical protein
VDECATRASIYFRSRHGQRSMLRLHRITVDVDALRRLQTVANRASRSAVTETTRTCIPRSRPDIAGEDIQYVRIRPYSKLQSSFLQRLRIRWQSQPYGIDHECVIHYFYI